MSEEKGDTNPSFNRTCKWLVESHQSECLSNYMMSHRPTSRRADAYRGKRSSLHKCILMSVMCKDSTKSLLWVIKPSSRLLFTDNLSASGFWCCGSTPRSNLPNPVGGRGSISLGSTYKFFNKSTEYDNIYIFGARECNDALSNRSTFT